MEGAILTVAVVGVGDVKGAWPGLNDLYREEKPLLVRGGGFCWVVWRWLCEKVVLEERQLAEGKERGEGILDKRCLLSCRCGQAQVVSILYGKWNCSTPGVSQFLQIKSLPLACPAGL